MESIQEVNFHVGNMTAALLAQLLNDGILHATDDFDGALDLCNILPLKAEVSPGLGVVLGDLTPSDYAGAADVAATWAGDLEDENGNPYVVSQIISFAPSSGSQTITSLALTDPTAAIVYACENLDPPVTVEDGRPLKVIITVSGAIPEALG